MSAVDVRAWLLTNQERENPHSRIDDVRGDGTAWSSGNTVRAIVHGRPYFEELHELIIGLGPGARLYFADWRGDPDEQLTDDPASTLNATLVAAAKRGVDVRGLLWRSHWHRLGFSAHRHRYLGDEIGEAGGQCLRDMRVRTRGAHHQKFVVIRDAEDPTRDVAYLGGIDLCHGRRDDHAHHGDPQPVELAKAYGPTPPWHDVQVAIQGPAVHDVETTFRERWEDSTPLTLNPGRLVSSWVHREDLSPEPLGAQAPPPPPRPDGHDVVQIVRTFPVISPKGFDFAPEGERSVMLGNTKAIAHADRLVYVEDQYLWSDDVGEHFATALRQNPELRLVVVLPMVPDLEGALAEVPQLYGRSQAMRTIIEAGGDRVAVFGLCNEAGIPIYVHSKTCVIDHGWASVGSDNLNRRSWTSDSELACTVVDERGDLDEPGPEDSFPRVLLRTLVAEHLGCDADDVPEDPHELFDAMVACADTLDEWYAGGAPDKSGIRGVLTGRVPHRIAPVPRSVAPHIPGHRKRRELVAARAEAMSRRGSDHAARPPGRLRRLAPTELTNAQLRWAPRLYDLLFDPDGRPHPGAGARTMAKRRDVGAWSKDPRDALRAGPDFDLDAMDRGETPWWEDDKKSAKRFGKQRGKLLSELQERLFAEGRAGVDRALLLIVQGLDTAGKGGVARHVMSKVDPQGVALRSFGPPTEEEQEHHFLWRVRKELPDPGLIGVFDRSHYEDVLIARVDGLVPRATWEGRFDEINRFESDLVEAGTTVLKFGLIVSHNEQGVRLMKRVDRPDKHWKYSANDRPARRQWDDYQEAYADVFRRTSTDAAPWYVVPADHKWYARLAITEILTQTLSDLDARWPSVRWDPMVQRRASSPGP